MAIYLQDNPPHRSQFYTTRYKPATGCVVLHTTESSFGTPRSNVASFIRSRPNAGSYHTLSDAHGWTQLGDYGWTMFSVRNHNSYTLNHSFTMKAADWSHLTPSEVDDLLTNGAKAVASMNRWMKSAHNIEIPARHISMTQASTGQQAGFTTHAELDPTRRSDPGREFPWELWFRAYAAAADVADEGDVDVIGLQLRLNGLGATLTVDGIYGPKTDGAVVAHLKRSVTLAAVEQALK